MKRPATPALAVQVLADRHIEDVGQLLLQEAERLLDGIVRELRHAEEIRTERFRAHLAEMRADMAEFRAGVTAFCLAPTTRSRKY